MHTPENCSTAYNGAEGRRSREKLAGFLLKQLLPIAQRHTRCSWLTCGSIHYSYAYWERNSQNYAHSEAGYCPFSTKGALYQLRFQMEKPGQTERILRSPSRPQAVAEGRFLSHKLCIQDMAITSCWPQVPLLQVTAGQRATQPGSLNTALLHELSSQFKLSSFIIIF